MTRYKARWGTEEHAEFEALVKESKLKRRPHERADHFLAGIQDAIQAQRPWAREVMADILSRGSASLMKSEERRGAQGTVAVTHEGRVLEKPRTLGVRRRDDDGSEHYERTLFDFMTVDELRAKWSELDRMSGSVDDTKAMVGRLIALCEQAVTETPAEAAARLGVSVEEWLAA